MAQEREGKKIRIGEIGNKIIKKERAEQKEWG